MRVACADVTFNTQRDFQRAQRMTAARHAPPNPPPTEPKKPIREVPVSQPQSAKGAAVEADNSSHSRRHELSVDAADMNVEQWLAQGVDANLLTIKRILEHFLGHEINVGVVVASRADDQEHVEQAPPPAAEQQDAASDQWVHLSLREAERTDVAIAADIQLQSGATIQVAIDQRMARSLVIEKDMKAQAAAAYLDPLVINFGGPVALSDKRVDFDLNADGVDEQIASFASASGFIAWDKNGDGTINDGSELFGAVSGDGFAELALYDDDHNGFIDEGDAIFSQLLVYRPGESKTSPLLSSDVAALYLGNVTTSFQLDGRSSDELGQVRATGFYVGGSDQQGYYAGTLQQIDLVV